MKPNHPWTEAELKTVRDLTLSAESASTCICRTAAAIRGKRQRLGLVPKKTSSPVSSTATIDDDRNRTRGDYWKQQFATLQRKYEESLRQSTAVEQLVALATDLAPTAYKPRPFVKESVRDNAGKPQSAVLLLSDTHVGQVIEPNQTLGFGRYNFEVFLARLKFLEDGVISIIRDHTTTEIPELVVCLGGDMIDGALDHGAEVGQHSTLFSQFYGAGHALAQFLRNLSAHVPRIRVQTTVGNHPRWSHQKKMPTRDRFSNLDQFLYAYIQALTRDIREINWNLDMQPFSLFEVQGFLFHLSHGDQLRGGDRALGIPNHAVGRMVSANSQMFGKTGQPSPHYYLTGHLHREISLPHARGSVIVNGGFPGIDGFGLANGFSPVDPMQVFFFVHPKYGRTATYPIQLKFAEVTADRPYDIPANFPVA